jgi:hypothetical protein
VFSKICLKEQLRQKRIEKISILDPFVVKETDEQVIRITGSIGQVS